MADLTDTAKEVFEKLAAEAIMDWFCGGMEGERQVGIIEARLVAAEITNRCRTVVSFSTTNGVAHD